MVLLSYLPTVCVASDAYEVTPYISMGLLKTTNLGAFEQYLSNGSSSGQGSSSSGGQGSSSAGGNSIGGSFSPASNPHDVEIKKVDGYGILGQAGLEQSIRFGSTTANIRYGLLAFFDVTNVAASAPSGWSIFTDPIDAFATNQINAVGVIGGIQIFQYESNYHMHRLYAEVGTIHAKTTSNLVAKSLSLNVNLTDHQAYDSALFMLEYEWTPKNKSGLGLIADVLAFPSPYFWNAGVSIGIRKAFE